MEKKHQYTLYDARALTNKDRATVYTVCETLEEALSDKKEMFNDAVIFKEYLEKQKDGSYITWSSHIIK